MVSKDRITLNECSNDGTSSFVYKSEEGGGISFGYSAYNLRNLANECSFSDEMQMPMVIISSNNYDKLLELAHTEIDGYLVFQNDKPFSFEDYKHWVFLL